MAIIDIEALLAPVSDDSPAGEDLEYDGEFFAVEEAAKEVPAQHMGDSVVEGREADWVSVKKLSQALFSRGKHLQQGLWLCQALMRTDGYPGLAAGLELLDQLMRRFWGNCYPELDPDDDQQIDRLNIIEAVTDHDTFITPLRHMTLVSSRILGAWSLWHMDVVQGNASLPHDYAGPTPDHASINGAFMDVDIDSLKSTSEIIAQSQNAINSIDEFLGEKLGAHNAPDFSALTNTLNEALEIVEDYIKNREQSEDPIEQVTTAADTEAPVTNVTQAASTAPIAQPRSVAQVALTGDITNPNDVIAALDKIIGYYDVAEPSSPIPLLLKRAKSWVSKDFMDILSDIAPNGVEQAKVVTGYKPEQAQAEAASRAEPMQASAENTPSSEPAPAAPAPAPAAKTAPRKSRFG